LQTNRLYSLFIILLLFSCISPLVFKTSIYASQLHKTTAKEPFSALKSIFKYVPKKEKLAIINGNKKKYNSFSKDSLSLKDSITTNKDTVLKAKNKEAILYTITHSAEDYIIEDVIQKKVTLYNKAKVIYDEYKIDAGTVLIDYKTNTVTAKGIPDEEDKYSQLPVFKSKGNETTQDSLIFNYKTKKAIIYGLETSQDGINTLGEKTKRVNDSTIFVRNIVFTTSDPRNPDYYLKTTKAKIIPGKKIITGPTNLVLADVPTPIIFPFAFFPLTKNKASGLIFPTYGESFSRGFFLQNGGYYFAGNDYFDLKLTGDIYSNSSWGLNASTNYKVRYKFGGNFNFKYENLISGIEGLSDFGVNKNFNIRWSHSQDAKSSPNSRFSASVNLGSSQYYRQSVNETNQALSLQNTLNSSITYSKTFTGTPFKMTVSANHSQNTNTGIVNATLPNLQINMDRQYPFAPKSGSKKNAIENIGLNYSVTAQNRISTTEEKFFSNQIFDDAQNGARHNASVNTSFNVLKHITVSPSLTYREVWYSEGIDKNYDLVNNEVVTDTIAGFNAFRDYSASTSLNTTIYGMFKFNKGSIQAIRHTMRPTISYSYRPDFSFYYQDVQSDATGENFETFSRFDGGIYGAPSRGTSNSLTFSLANTLEAKIKDKESLEGKGKKINLLNALNFRTAYDFTAESFKLSPVSATAGTTLFKKMNINLSATLDPYYLQNNNDGTFDKIDALSYKNGGPLFRVTNARFSTGYSFSSKDFDKDKKKDNQKEEETAYDQNLFGEGLANTNQINQQEQQQKEPNNKKEKSTNLPQYISTIPWNLRFSYSTNYLNNTGQNEISANTLSFSGDIELSPGWKVGMSSGYDFVNKGFTYTNFRFTRDLRSWTMNFNWNPIGINSSYYFFIGVKASVLSDLKWDKRETNLRF